MRASEEALVNCERSLREKGMRNERRVCVERRGERKAVVDPGATAESVWASIAPRIQAFLFR